MTIETFVPEHRPIVEFALDNVQTLKLRKEKLQYQQQSAVPGDSNAKENEEPHITSVRIDKKDRKRKSREHVKPVKDSMLNKEDESGSAQPNRNATQESNPKRQKGDHKSNKARGSWRKENSDAALSTKPKNSQDGQNHGSGTPDIDIDSNKTKYGKKVDHGLKKRKVQNQGEVGEKVQKKRSKKNKEPVGKDVVDKLDMLIEQYRSKFSHQGSKGNDGGKNHSKQLRKWFEP